MIFALLAIAFADYLTVQKVDSNEVNLAPLYNAQSTELADEYFVVLKSSKDQKSGNVLEFHRKWLVNRMKAAAADAALQGFVRNYYEIGNFIGYKGHFNADMINEIRAHPDTAYVERFGRFVASENKGTFEPSVKREGVSWGLQRISQKEALPQGSDWKALNYNFTSNPNEQGEGATVYLVGSEIAVNHQEYRGRAQFGRNFCRSNTDIDWQGTAVASIVGGVKTGVAPKAQLVAVKVDCDSFPWDYGLIDAINWVVKEHTKTAKWPWDPVPARRTILAAIYSRIPSRSAESALNAAVDQGIFVLNPFLSLDTCSSVPKKSFIVSASNIADESIGNVGECVNMFAPGDGILVANVEDDNSYGYATSATVPVGFVAGAVAAIWSALPANTSVADLKDIVRQRAATDVISGARNAPNLLLNL